MHSDTIINELHQHCGQQLQSISLLLFLPAPYCLCAGTGTYWKCWWNAQIYEDLFLVQRHFIAYNHPSKIVATQPQRLIVMGGIQLLAIISINSVAGGELPH